MPAVQSWLLFHGAYDGDSVGFSLRGLLKSAATDFFCVTGNVINGAADHTGTLPGQVEFNAGIAEFMRILPLMWTMQHVSVRFR